MTIGKLNLENHKTLGLCWSPEQTAKAAALGGKEEYTIDEILLAPWVGYDDAMFTACRLEVVSAEVLREFAAVVARSAVEALTGSNYVPNMQPFLTALEYMESGGSDVGAFIQHGEAIQGAMMTLVLPGMGDADKPEKIVEYERIVKAAKAVRAACKAGAGEAAYGAATWEFRAAADEEAREALGKKQRGQLAKLVQASNG